MEWWYPLVRAARYLGVAPWVLAEQPVFWEQVALECEVIDAHMDAYRMWRAEQSRRFYQGTRARMN